MRLNVEIPRPVGAVLVLASVLLVGGVAIAGAYNDLSATLAERDASTAFVARSLSTKPTDPEAVGATAAPLTISANTDTLAAASLDMAVRDAVVNAGGSVVSTQAEAKNDETGAPGQTERIEVQANVQGSIEALQAALYRLEAGRPLVLVDTLSIHPAEVAADATSAPSRTLSATLTVSAYWRRPEP